MSDYNAPNTPPPAGTTPATPDYGRPQQGTNPLAIVSLVLSIGSLLLCCLPLGGALSPIIALVVAIVGAVLGGVAEKQIREGRGGGMGLAKAGRITGIITSILITIALILTIAGIGYLASEAGQDALREQGLEYDSEAGGVRDVEPDVVDEPVLGEPVEGIDGVETDPVEVEEVEVE